MFPNVGQNFVFREEARKRRNTRNGDGANQERPERDGQVLVQATHLADVLLITHSVNHATGTEEQQGFEKGVGQYVEHTACVGRHAQAEEHITQLTNRGVSQHFLDVVLHQANRRTEQSRSNRNAAHNLQRLRSQRV